MTPDDELSSSVVTPASEWTYVLTAVVSIALVVLVGLAINWWVAATIFVPVFVLYIFGFVRRARIRRASEP